MVYMVQTCQAGTQVKVSGSLFEVGRGFGGWGFGDCVCVCLGGGGGGGGGLHVHEVCQKGYENVPQ